jgi:hypothetical protein
LASKTVNIVTPKDLDQYGGSFPEIGIVEVQKSAGEANERRDTRSFAVREDIEVSLELSFGIA